MQTVRSINPMFISARYSCDIRSLPYFIDYRSLFKILSFYVLI